MFLFIVDRWLANFYITSALHFNLYMAIPSAIMPITSAKNKVVIPSATKVK